VLRGVRGVAKAGMTMIIVTHEVLYAREVADRIVFADDGVTVEQGPLGRLQDDPVHERTRRFPRGVAYEDGIAA
jgi:ABC-type polar amino acid transport system ATPase subunit